MLQVHILVVLLSLILIYFLVSRFRFDTIVDSHCYANGYHTFNSKHTGCDHSPSSCRDTDVSLKCPFQFKGDHADLCPDALEFSCDHNRTVLPLTTDVDGEEQRFYADIDSIDYRKQTLRIFDPGVQKDNCSTLPIYSFYEYTYEKQVGDIRYGRFVDIDPNTSELVFLSCKNPVESKSPLYIDTASCNITANHFSKMNAQSDYYSYVVIGKNVVASAIEESCTIHKIVRADLRCLPKVTGDISFQDIHNALANGFELSLSTRSTLRRSILCLLVAPFYNHVKFGTGVGFAVKFFVLLIAAKSVIGIALLCAFLLYRCHRRHLSRYDTIEDFLQTKNGLIPIRYSYKHIRAMTNNFKEKLGEGGYGLVYKGKLRSGDVVAVKMLNKSKADGQEFINEVATIGQIHHVNVVRLVGFCVAPSTHALVYDYMPNGSLDKLIFSDSQNGHPFSWKQTCEIAKGVARGMEYLHQGCNMQILHFDIKPHNILLDENFVPKVADFGLAKLYPMQKSFSSLTAVRGTLGYMAPELFYKKIGRVSDKADVYSYGMLLMEIAGRRRNGNGHVEHSSQIYFPSWIYDKFDRGEELEIGDHATEEEKSISRRLILIALWCTQMTPEDCPLMREVLEMLEGDLSGLKLPHRLLFYSPDSPISMQGSSNISSSDESTVTLCSSIALEIEQLDD
ncbi:rust resistance kinase Lr10-like [Coffea arabica]|uniref:Rust resistance kinase Lr10-like n=1 Tax=Coffea arabica TaxID=13443 RepID=A0ABM4UZC5_COFAR